MSSKREIQYMFYKMLKVDQDEGFGICKKTNLHEKTPLDLLEERLSEANPYDTNLHEVKEVCLEKLQSICNPQCSLKDD